jgi:hypothetical protein
VPVTPPPVATKSKKTDAKKAEALEKKKQRDLQVHF